VANAVIKAGQSKANQWMHVLLPVLLEALRALATDDLIGINSI